jgi:hypothetical protein
LFELFGSGYLVVARATAYLEFLRKSNHRIFARLGVDRSTVTTEVLPLCDVAELGDGNVRFFSSIEKCS